MQIEPTRSMNLNFSQTSNLVKYRRVLFVLPAFSGGASQGVYEFLKAAPRLNFEPILVFPQKPSTESQSSQIRELKVRTHSFLWNWWNLKITMTWPARILYWLRMNLATGFHLFSIIRFVKLIQRENVDAVVTISALTLDSAIAAKLTRRPHLWHIKESVGWSGWMKFPLPDFLLARLIGGLSDHILLMSEFVGTILRSRIEPDRISVLRDSVCLSDFSIEPATQGDGQKTPLIVGLVASPVSAVKRHDVFLRMAALLKDEFPLIEFRIYGALPSKPAHFLYAAPYKHYRGLLDLAEHLNLGSCLKWMGHRSDIASMMNEIDILVHTCEVEGFGRIAIEAMAAGRPVVGPETGGVSESVVHEKTGLLSEPLNPEAFAISVSRLALDPLRRAQMGKEGRRRVCEFYSEKQHVNHMFWAIEKAIKSKGVKHDR